MASPAVAMRRPSPTVLASAPRRRPRRHEYSPSNMGSPSSASRLKVTALFGWIKGDRYSRTRELIPSAESYTLTGSASEVDMKPREVSISVVSSIMDIPPAEWDACAVDSVEPEKFNPFLTHAFLSSLEESGSAVKLNVSSLHITFPSEGEFSKLKDSGLLQRVGLQYHWTNRNYKCFDDFLMDLKQPKRKNIRQERKKIPAQNLKMKRLRGDEIKSSHWDTFYRFYRNTTDNHWGRAYLTQEFFHLLGEKMGDKVMLIVAEHDDKVVAGALNLIGGDTLYGRLWGCLPDAHFPNLHFEACYYQAIEAAIELNLSKVEAGAQGEHKIQRGYLPVTTYSCHYFLEPGFATAIGNFLVHETAQVKHVINVLHESGPYKEDILKEFAPQPDGEM
ncbi:hypothetical protein CFC21_023856 [Triticum aestivum]|uniref:Uncharacterized protein n=3 Tax=Triticum TaxID=4564 RepID=A0A9R1PQY1_TRITD|nr:hypothetical protein CFC21_023856 [Triticum aestivum]VAH48060.1 unnamed protein product [Triticum turgidum subsp. durum]